MGSLPAGVRRVQSLPLLYDSHQITRATCSLRTAAAAAKGIGRVRSGQDRRPDRETPHASPQSQTPCSASGVAPPTTAAALQRRGGTLPYACHPLPTGASLPSPSHEVYPLENGPLGHPVPAGA